MDDAPNYAVWLHDELAAEARAMYLRIQQDKQIIEQLRLNNRDLSQLLRDKLLNTDDWK